MPIDLDRAMKECPPKLRDGFVNIAAKRAREILKEQLDATAQPRAIRNQVTGVPPLTLEEMLMRAYTLGVADCVDAQKEDTDADRD